MADLVTTAEAQSFLGVTGYDTLIGELIDYVTAGIESYTGRYFTATSVTEYIDGGGDALVVSRPPIISVTSISDHHDTDALLASTNYETELSAGMIVGSPSADSTMISVNPWASGRRRWKVVYSSGYASIPANVKLAALTWLADIFANRQGAKSESLGDRSFTVDDTMPSRVKLLLSTYKDIVV